MEKRIVKLTNGKKVGNFSSNKPYIFSDGSILPPVSEQEHNRLQLRPYEKTYQNGDIILDFQLKREIHEEMMSWLEVYNKREVDFVFCSREMMRCLHVILNKENIRTSSPFRVGVIVDEKKRTFAIDKQII